MNVAAHQTYADGSWLGRICRWLPLLTLGALIAAWALGLSLPTIAATTLLLLCPAVCLVLFLESREVERKIVAAVEQQRSGAAG